MKVLLLDTETTGLDFTKDRVIEIGVQMADDEFNLIGQDSILMWDSKYPAITPEIERITGITEAELHRYAHAPEHGIGKLNTLLAAWPKADVVIAYNADYDLTMMKNEITRSGAMQLEGIYRLMGIPWLCAMTDLETNYKYKCWKLSHLALEYGVAVDPKKLHRALPDVDLTRRLLLAAGAKPQDILAFKNIPWIYVEALTQPPWKDNSKSTTLAKEQGFSWESARGDWSGKKFTKKWVKRIKSNKFDDEVKKCPFQIDLL